MESQSATTYLQNLKREVQFLSTKDLEERLHDDKTIDALLTFINEREVCRED